MSPVKYVFVRWINLLVFALSLIITTPFVQAVAQQAALVPSEDPAYALIERLQRRGRLGSLNPSLRPYTYGALQKVLDQEEAHMPEGVETEWMAQLRAIVGPTEASPELTARFGVAAGMMHSSSKRYDPLRPLGSKPFADPRVEFSAVLNGDQWVASTGLTHDMFYDRDPDGLDVVNRFFMRGENTYLGYTSRYLDVHVGRFGTHWNRVGIEAPLIGDEVRQYDKIALRIGGERISLRSIYGELDNLDSVGVYLGRGFRAGSVRRYVFAHRIDWNLSPALTLSVFEGDLISGTNAGLSLKYVQPLHVVFFEQDNTPKNYENNLMVGAGFHARRGGFSATGQFILDDIVILDREVVKREGRLEPTTMQATIHMTYGGVKPNIDIGLSSALVSSMSYRTDQKEGQWSYAQHSLATPFADYAHVRLFMDWYADVFSPGLTLTPALNLLAQGTGNFRDDFVKAYEGGRLLPAFLSGTEMVTVRTALGVDYRFYRLWIDPNGFSKGWELYLKADLGVNVVHNHENQSGMNAVQFHSVGKITLKRGF